MGSGRFLWTSEVFNSHAPEFPNMAMLQLFGAMGGTDDTLTRHSVAYRCALVAHRGWT